ncbi:hypothetical protein Droror1_Dr00027752 [Drosera rotundifolia]
MLANLRCGLCYGWYFTFIQGFVYLALIRFNGFDTKQMVNPWNTYVKLSVVLMGSHGLTKWSLAFLNYPAQIMFKSTKISCADNRIVLLNMSSWEILKTVAGIKEAVYAYLQLASHQRDCCLKLIDSDNKCGNTSRNDNSSLRWSKQLAERYRQKAIEARLFAENNWLRALEFYNVDTHQLGVSLPVYMFCSTALPGYPG